MASNNHFFKQERLTVEETIAELYSNPFSYISDTEWCGRVCDRKFNENRSI